MAHHCFCVTICMLLVLGEVRAKPARPLYEPREPEKVPVWIANINGTTWDGLFDNWKREFRFEGGSQAIFFPGGRSGPYRGTWAQNGKKVYFEILSGELEFYGEFQSYDTLVGVISESGIRHRPFTLKLRPPVRH